MHYAALATDAGLERVALRLLRTRGPVTPGWLSQRYGIPATDATAALDRLADKGLVRRGEYVAGAREPQYVHLAVLEEIQRRQVHARRKPRPVATAEQFSAALLRRHHLHPDHRLTGPAGVLAAVELLQGEDFPVRVWEQDMLAPRVEDYQRDWLDRLGLAGEIVWTVFEPRETTSARAGRVGLSLRENAGWLRPKPSTAELDPQVKNVLLHLQLRGASFAQDIGRVAGLDTERTLRALWELFWAGFVTPDTFTAIVAGTAPPRSASSAPSRRRHRRGARRAPLQRLPVIGRWSALAEEEALSPEEREEARAHLLLARYGVLSRELAQGDWSTLRHTLLRMEYGGEVVRGYFVEGLSGEQYALEDTLRELESPPSRRAEPHVLVNIADPANLWGRVFTLSRRDGARAGAARIPTTWLVSRHGRPVLLAEGQGRSLTTLAGWENVDLTGAVRALQSVVDRPLPFRPVRRLEVFEWDGQPVRESSAFDALVAAGFGVDGARLFWDGHPGPR
jgi:ATP-dependent Lhr-like helicase